MTQPARPSPFRSAEFMVAGALLAVCAAVGGAWWFLSARDKPDSAVTGAAQNANGTPAGAHSEEQAALDTWNRKLQGDFAQLDKQRQAQDQRNEQERRRLETEATALRQAQQRAAEAAAPKPQPAPPPPPPLPQPVQTASEAKTSPPPAPAHQPVRSEASIDWTSCKRPAYPRPSLDRNEEGTVVLSFKVGADGVVQDGDVSSSSGSPWLDNAALQALRKCRFKPATLDSAAVAATANVKFQWRLGQ